MSEVVCISESVYRGALTRGKHYSVLAADPDARQFRVRGDNGRARWFPAYCFDRGDRPVPVLAGFQLDDSIEPGEDLLIEVTVQLSSGERRWCVFATPAALASCGDWIEGTEISFHYHNRHIIVAGRLSEERIERVLRYIDAQGELIECTLPLADTSSVHLSS